VGEAFTQALEEHNGHHRAITQVSIDMSPAYIAGVKENIGDQAEVVFDKFHVIAHVNDAADEVRRQEMRWGGWATRNDLKETRWIWLKNAENLSDKQKAKQQRLEDKNLLTAKAYPMRLTLQAIYQTPHTAPAKKKLLAWCRWVRRVAKKHTSLMFKKMLGCAKMIEKHLAGILAHQKRQTTNAFLEVLNSVFSAIKRKARGFRSTDTLIAMLYFTAGNLKIPATYWK
jgi:transposase